MTAPNGLVGKAFHIFGKDQEISRQGIVVAQADPGFYIVQYFDFIVGNPSTMEVVNINAMTVSPVADNGSYPESRACGAWQFHEDTDHMNSWYEDWERRAGRR